MHVGVVCLSQDLSHVDGKFVSAWQWQILCLFVCLFVCECAFSYAHDMLFDVVLVDDLLCYTLTRLSLMSEEINSLLITTSLQSMLTVDC